MKRIIMGAMISLMLVSIGGCLVGLDGRYDRDGRHDRDGSYNRDGRHDRDHRYDERR